MIGPYELNTIVTGDARELAKAIPDESIDLIFTDPVYDRIEDYRWLAETAVRVLKDTSAVLVWCGIDKIDKALAAMGECLQYRWTFASVLPVGKKGAFAQYQMFSNWRCLLWLDLQRQSRGKKFFSDVSFEVDNNYSGLKGWGKSIATSSWWLQAFSGSGETVFDPFTGGGTVPAVCKMLGRNYLAFEIDPATAEMARQRVANTQPPLFVPEAVQLGMELP